MPALEVIWSVSRLARQRAQVLDDAAGVGGGVQVGVAASHLALRVDQKGMTLGEFQHQQVGERAIAGGYLAIRVAQQREGQQVFLGKGRVAFLAVQADADDFSPQELEFDKVIAKTACLFGATLGLVFRVKIQHQPAATKLAQIA